MKIKHIYWFASFNLNCPSTRYRGQIPLKHLSQNNGIESDFVYPERSINGILKFLRTYLSALLFRKSNSLIIIQKVCSNRLYANALKLLIFFQPKNTQYDLDDAEYLRQDTKSLHFFLRKCKTISVGSTDLKEYCLQFNSNVFVLTSPVKIHNIRKRKRNEKIHIGWVGDFGNGNETSKEFSHKTSLFNILFPELRKMNKQIKLILLGVKKENDIPEISKYFNDTSNIELEIPTNLNWQNDDWLYAEIAKFDIGVSPMTNHPFNRSKSAFKAKQYLSVGVPTIASDVGENKRFVLHNKNGFVCKESKDFLIAIQRVAEMNDKEYFEMSKNALIRKEEYSVEKYCYTLIEKQKNTIQ